MAMTTSPRPKPKPLSMKRPMKRPPDFGMSEAEKTDMKNKLKGDVLHEKKGGAIKEGSAKDMREDKAMAKKRGMSMKKWERSAADAKHDAPKKMASGGVMRGTGAAIRGKKYAGEL